MVFFCVFYFVVCCDCCLVGLECGFCVEVFCCVCFCVVCLVCVVVCCGFYYY